MNMPSNAIIQTIRNKIRKSITCGDCTSCKLNLWTDDREPDRTTARITHEEKDYYYVVYCTCYKRFIPTPDALLMCESHQNDSLIDDMLKLPAGTKKSRYVCHKDSAHGAMMAVPNIQDDNKPNIFYHCLTCDYKTWHGKKNN